MGCFFTAETLVHPTGFEPVAPRLGILGRTVFGVSLKAPEKRKIPDIRHLWHIEKF
jgi:hypothetical protein